MMLHFGILAGQDKILEEGDIVTDPFNVLDVKEVYIDKEFAVLFNDIDYNKLVDCTANFNRIEWDQYIQYLKFPQFAMMYNEKEREVIVRFAWWLCHQVVYKQKDQRIIQLDSILSDNSLYNQLRLYIYTGNANLDYHLRGALTTEAGILILFKDKTNL